VAFNGLARTLEQLQTGARVAVSGRLSVKFYDKEGERRTSFSVVASEITFLTRAGRGAAETSDGPQDFPEPLGDDDIPF
jgi:single-stranded DNA-binding protein